MMMVLFNTKKKGATSGEGNIVAFPTTRGLNMEFV